MTARAEEDRRLVPLEGPEAAGGLAGLGWVPALAGLDGRGVEGATGAVKGVGGQNQLPDWTDAAASITISLLLRPAAGLGEIL